MRALLIALLFASSTANAAEWVEVGDSDVADFKVYVDKASIVKSFPGKKAWFKFVFRTVQKGPKGVQFDESLQLVYFDCDERKMSVSQVTVLKDGKVITTESDPIHLAKAEEIAPESNAEEMLEAACSGRVRVTSHAEAVELQVAGATQPESAQVDAEPVNNAQRVGAPAKVTRPANPDDFYPPGSKRREEQGSPVVQACVGPNGRLLREPVVTDTSGFPELDSAAVKVAKATRYAAGTDNGAAASESCIKFKVKFALRY